MSLVKICGLRTWDDTAAAVEAGADFLGFVCDANSPRTIEPADFVAIAERLPGSIKCIGVFHHTPADSWKEAGSEVFQLFHQIQYADDSLWSATVGEDWDMRRKIKYFHLSGSRGLRGIANYNGLAQSYLVNVHLPHSSRTKDSEELGWELAREVWQFGKKLYLAGGLTPDNVGRAIALVLPYAVDVTVGVESSPGVKDHELMRRFVRAAKG